MTRYVFRDRYHVLGVRCASMIILSLSTLVVAGDRAEFCIGEKFQASCSSTLSSSVTSDGLPPPEGRIVMKYARYGRTRLGRCIQKQFDGYHGCSVDVIDTMHRMCSGRSSCSVDVFQTFSWLRPCSELEPFLDAEYECVLAIPSCHRVLDVSQPTSSEIGYISGLGSRDNALSGVGTCQTTFVLRARPGQRWNISLVDFAAVQAVQSSATGTSMVAADSLSPRCLRYAQISEGDKDQRLSAGSQPYKETAVVCGGIDVRERSVYLSETETVRLEVYGHRAVNDGDTSFHDSGYGQFLIKYNVIGCVDPDQLALNSATGRRETNLMIITCNSTGLEYRLHCVGNTWSGLANHSCAVHDTPKSVWYAFQQSWTSVYGVIAVTVLGIALGVLVGCTMLGIAAMCHRYRDAIIKRNSARDTAAGCPLSAAYRSDDVSRLERPSNVGCKQLSINGGCAPYNAVDYFDDRSMAKYGTNPAYSAMVNSSTTAGNSRNVSTTSGYCTDRNGLSSAQDTAAMTAMMPPPLGGLRLPHSGRFVQQSTCPWQTDPEVVDTVRNYFYVHDARRPPEVAGESSIGQSIDVGSPFTAYTFHGTHESSAANAADGYNESILSNTSSALDDHIYEIAG